MIYTPACRTGLKTAATDCGEPPQCALSVQHPLSSALKAGPGMPSAKTMSPGHARPEDHIVVVLVADGLGREQRADGARQFAPDLKKAHCHSRTLSGNRFKQRRGRHMKTGGADPGNRGKPFEILDQYRFTSREEAEWAVFRLRWEALTGHPPALD